VKKQNNNGKMIWFAVLILLICVAATAIAFISRMDPFLPDDSGAISLVGPGSVSDDVGTGKPSHTTTPSPDTETGEDTSSDSSADGGNGGENTPQKAPSFEAGDEKTVWSTNTSVEIFRVSYENGEQRFSVNSLDGDNLIAPGTTNSYTFKVKNTGNVALDYTVEMDAYITPEDTPIPITGRVLRYDGEWIVGDNDGFADVPALDATEDNSTLGAGRYAYYTLEWTWPFEGDDILDTELGNLATGIDLVFTVEIRTIAKESVDPYADGGLEPPQTGDNSNLTLWAVVGAAAVCLAFVIFVYLLNDKNNDKNDKNNDKRRFAQTEQN